MTRNARWGYDTGLNDLIPGERTFTIDQTVVHFGDVTGAADAFIRESEQLVGAVAWVRAPRLIDALSSRPVSLVVNKEFALRNRGTKEREALVKLREPADGFTRTARVVGDCRREAFTGLMHHKFLVRLTRGIPAAVWNGSLNFTSGAAGNFENAIEVHDPAVAVMFYDEFVRLWGISEPLDFTVGRAKGMPKTDVIAPRAAPTRATPPRPTAVKTASKPTAKKRAPRARKAA